MSKKEKLKFTVIIPTRDRSDTLESSLRTCVSQDYDNLEIIVSDNFSQDKTKEVVESFKDSRIRYINTGKRLSMSHNWEFALSHVDGGYVMYLGDDDGILPGAFTELNEIINKTGCEAICWNCACYNWPCCINEHQRNTLAISLQTSLEERNSEQMLIDVINLKRTYLELPTLYRGLVSHHAIKKAMSKGIFFYSMTPDVYSAIALSCVLKTYYYSFKPYAMIGSSGHSIGRASFSSAHGLQAAAPKKFLSEDNIPFHSKLTLTSSLPIFMAESFLQAQDHIPSAKCFEINIKKVLQVAVEQVTSEPRSRYDTIIEAVKKIAHLNNLDHYLPQIISPHQGEIPDSKPMFEINISNGYAELDCTEFCVRNVYDASLLCKHVIVLGKLGHFKTHVIKNQIKKIPGTQRLYNLIKGR